MIAVPLFVGAILLASTMLGTGVWLGARDYGRPDDGPDMSDLKRDDDWYDRNEAAAWAAVRRDWEADLYASESSSSLAGVMAAEETQAQR